MSKLRKNVLSIVLTLVMVATTVMTQSNLLLAAYQPTLSVVADKENVKRGETFEVKVALKGDIEVASGQTTLNYDQDKLELVEVEKGDILSSPNIMLQDINQAIVGKIKVAFMYQIDKAAGAGELFTAKFKMKDDASGKVEFSLTDIEFNEIDFDTIDVKIVNGTVDVYIPLQSISINQTSLVMEKGDTKQLSVIYNPEDASDKGAIQWSSSNKDVVTVTKDGMITAVGKGKAVITAKVGEIVAKCQVQVNSPLKGITVKETLNLKKGQSELLQVLYQPEDAEVVEKISWSSSNESVAIVSKEGRVTALKDGVANITATIGNFSATCTVTVQEIKLESISLNKTEITIARKDSEQLTVIYTPEETTDNKSVTWSVSDSRIISVDGSGIVTGKAVGKAIVTASVGQYKAQCEVTVNAPLKEISFVSKTLELVKGQTSKELVSSLIFLPEDTTDSKVVNWISNDTEVVTVDNEGKLTAIKAGKATITVEGVNGVKATCEVTVKEIPVEGIVLNFATAEVEKEKTLQLNAIVYPENTTDDKTISWKSEDSSIASVDKNGLVTAHKGGETIITATATNGKKAECKIVVPIHMTGIEIIEPDKAEVLKGNTITLFVKPVPQNTTDSYEVTWASSDKSIATIDKDGMVVGVKNGEVIITARSGEFTDTIKITVREIALQKIEISCNKDNLTDGKLLKGQKLELGVNYIPENTTEDRTVTWTSSDEEIAYVDPNGIVVGVKAGRVTITAYVGTVKETLELEVIEIPLESIAFDKIITSMVEGEKNSLGIIYNPDNTTDVKDVTWSSSDEEIISVEDGNLVAKKAGTATIIAKVGKQSVSCEIIVKAKDVVADKPQIDVPSTEKDDATSNTPTGDATSNIPTGDVTNMWIFALIGVGSLFTIFMLILKKVRR